MNNRFNKDEGAGLLDGFTADFPDWLIEEFFVELKPGARINVFCCKVATIDSLASEWRQISSFVGAKSITQSPSNFSRWNSYLVYFCEEHVPRSLKYEIENDKFASRKIIEGEWSDADEAIISFLNEELLLSHVNLHPDLDSEPEDVKGISVLGREIVTHGIIAGGSNKSSRKTWLDAAVITQVERHTNEN